MNPNVIETQQQNNKGNKNTMLLAVAISIIIFGVFIGGIFIILNNKQKKLINYKNPFAQQTQKTIKKNPFAQPTAVSPNPFGKIQSQTANKPYQNPFGGGQ